MITIDIHLEITDLDYRSNVEANKRDLLAEIREALDAVVKFRHSDRIKVRVEDERFYQQGGNMSHSSKK